MATFYSRYEKALRMTATSTVVAGRLQGAAPITIADLTNAGDTRSATAPFELFGPGDVDRVGAGAITRRFPAPGASDAEETKLALVEFGALDLPWRYTPQAAVGAVLRPWLVLVVGRRGPDELTLRPDGRVTIGLLTQANHALDKSFLWAHIHEVDSKKIARIVSPVNLSMETEYVACLVPAFGADGGDAWTGTGQTTCDCYDRWTFRTGPQGDFPDLAAKLHKADLATIEAAGGKPFGRADVIYQPRSPGAPPPIVLATAGALRLPPEPSAGPDPIETAPDAAVAAEVATLSERIVTADGRGVITAPHYPAPFTDPETTVIPGGWLEQEKSDPRVRGAAGLGAWAAIEWQDRIADAAAAKVGDLAIARDRIGHVALGVEASRSLWRRRLPSPEEAADPDAARAAAIARLAVLAPSLGRLPTDTHETVLDRIAGRTPSLGRAILSSAARRALRPGPARVALAQPGAGQPATVLEVANSCAAEPHDPTTISDHPDRDRVAHAVEKAILVAGGDDQESADRILNRFGGGIPGYAQLAAAFAALAPVRDGRPDPRAVDEYLETREFPDVEPPQLQALPNMLAEVAPAEPCEPINLLGLADAVSGAIDPTVDQPPAVKRVLSALPGITHIGPVEIEPELDLPLWGFLSARSPDWMLPGAGDLAEHEVVGLSTNPPFVQAMLTGANHQSTAELRWRNIPLVSRWSPLRKFWQRAGGQLDIQPIKVWPASAALGNVALAAAGAEPEAVVAFRTSLFRRYPATAVYLYPAAADWSAPSEGTPLLAPPADGRMDPTFTGTIGDDITFFGFAVPPSALMSHWVVLEEPPSGYRFYHEDAVPPPWPAMPDDTSANYAYNRFAQPVRVLIGPLL